MAEWCGLPDEGQWAPVAGDPATAPQPAAPVVAEPVPEDAIEISEELWDPCADYWASFPVDQEAVYEQTLTPVVILPPYSERVFLRGTVLSWMRLRSVDTDVVRLTGVTGHEGSASSATVVLPEIMSAVYTQSSVYSANTPATAAGMQNGTHQETTETGTNWHSEASGGPWVQMDFGFVRPFEAVVIGSDYSNSLAGGWGKEYAEFCDVFGSNDETNWTLLFNTGEFTAFANAVKTFETPGAAWQYVRIVGNSNIGYGYLAITEFHALTTHQFISLQGVTGSLGLLSSITGASSMGLSLTPSFTAMTVHAAVRRLWTPDGAPGLELWLNAIDPALFAYESGGVEQWNDKSGLGRHATRQTNHPRPAREISPINGLPGVRFNTNYNEQLYVWPRLWVPDSAETFKFLHNGPSQVYVAFSLEFGAAGDQCGIFTTFAGSGQIGAQLYMATGAGTTAGPQGQITGQSGNSHWFENGGSPMQRVEDGGLEWRGDPGNFFGPNRIQLYRNFTKETIAGSGTAAVSSGNPQLNLTIGYASRGGNTGAFVGLIHEILFFNTHHTLAERQRIWGYMMHGWKMQAKLPAEHPYRHTPPLFE